MQSATQATIADATAVIPPDPRATPARLPELLVVGDGGRLRSLRAAIERRGLVIRSAPDVAQVRIGGDTVAILLLGPLPRLELPDAIAALRREVPGNTLPIFVAAPEAIPDRRAVALYRSGASAVFAWPREALLLPRVLGELIASRAGALPSSEARLASSVLARLRQLATRRRPRRLRVRIRDGRVRLSGVVDSLWAKLKLAERAGQTPGVRAVQADGLSVERRGHDDAALGACLRRLLRGAAVVEARTLSISVHDGHVVVLGTVADEHQRRRVSELLGLADGVRSVSNLIHCEPETCERALALARRIESRLRGGFPDTPVEVAVIDGNAVLHGGPVRRSTRLAIRRCAYAEGAERVLDRLDAAGSEAASPAS